MKVKKIRIIFVLTGILTNSCIDQLDVNIDREESIIVVEGFITTQPGPHVIRISKSAKYGSAFTAGVITGVTNAKVFIRDQKGKVTFLNEGSGEYLDAQFNTIVTSFGDYTTPTGFRAVVGNSYTLHIIVSSKTYYSTPQLVTKAPEIDSLILEYKELLSFDPIEFASGDFVSGVEVYSQWQDPEDETNYYMWESSGTYKIYAHPWDHVLLNPFIGEDIPDPLDCCAICWIHEPTSDKSIRFMKDNNSNGNLVTNLVAFIEDDGGRYMDKYYITVQQLSISEEAYLFFKLLDNQLSINGDIFDPPPATIRGNMISLENPNETVIGYFLAADVSVKSIFISKEILGDKQILKVINDDCRVLLNSTVQPPPFWD